MKLLYVLLADHAFLSIDRKLNIIGVFETINAVKFPVTHPKFVVIGSIAPSKNKFKMSVVLSDEDGKPLMGKLNEKEIDLPAGAPNKNFNFIIEIINPSFPKPGDYKVQILVEGEKIGEQSLKVLEAPKPPGISLSDLKPS
jgi:hypothetical protein